MKPDLRISSKDYSRAKNLKMRSARMIREVGARQPERYFAWAHPSFFTPAGWVSLTPNFTWVLESLRDDNRFNGFGLERVRETVKTVEAA